MRISILVILKFARLKHRPPNPGPFFWPHILSLFSSTFTVSRLCFHRQSNFSTAFLHFVFHTSPCTDLTLASVLLFPIRKILEKHYISMDIGHDLGLSI